MGEKLRINRDWKFIHGDVPEGRLPAFDDGEWYDTMIPHSFGYPYYQENAFYVGYGCYRHWLEIRPEWQGKRMKLEFHGVFQQCEVYINGHRAGEHKGGYTAFQIDITPWARPGRNLLFVRVNNLWNAQLAPRAGEHVFNGGIYRDVSLQIQEPLHLSWYGTWVRTPEVSAACAEVLIRSEAENHTDTPQHCRLRSDLYLGDTCVGYAESQWELQPGETAALEQQVTVQDPVLWSPDTPVLYRLKSSLLQGGECRDSEDTWFGIRWFSFTHDQGFFLNGRHLKLWGANVHQDQGGWSDAVTHTGIRRDIRMIRDCGMNFIRGSHYPHHRVFAETCDQEGMLFWSELCYWGNGGIPRDGFWTASAYPVCEADEAGFEAHCRQTLEEMIRVNRNSPSIIAWSLCNEIFLARPDVFGKAKALLETLIQDARRLDPTRPAAVGGAQRGDLDRLGDLTGYNGDGAALFPDPGVPNLVSEYGSVVADRPGQYSMRFRYGEGEDFPWRSGKALWCGFHHGSIMGEMGHMGFIDYYRIPLKVWHWYRNQLKGIPLPEESVPGVPTALRLTADQAEMNTDGTGDVWLLAELINEEGRRVDCSRPVTLRAEGPGFFPTGKAMTLTPEHNTFRDGMGAMTMRAGHAGICRVVASSEGLADVSVTVTCTGGEAFGDRVMNYPPAPPSVMSAPVPEGGYETMSWLKPVFCSSSLPGREAHHVTAHGRDGFWEAGQESPDQWLMIDMEGCWFIGRMTISFREYHGEVFVVEVSRDGIVFEPLAGGIPSGMDEHCWQFTMVNLDRRFFRVRFPDAPAAIARILLDIAG